jgi:anti-sigma-K factor RskA
VSAQERDEAYTRAGEYVLGVLAGEEAQSVEREMRSNMALRAAVRYWEKRLLGMTAIAAVEAPPPELWPRIERNLGLAQAMPATPVRAAPPSLWQSLAFWRVTTGLGFAATAVLAVIAFVLPRPDRAPIAYTVVLQAPADKSVGWLVQADAENRVHLTPLGRTEVAPDKALQFWTKAESAKSPTSLGLVPPDRGVIIPAKRLPGLEPGQLFEITLEPLAGSPIGRPTGPVLYIGRAVKSM